MLKVQRHDNKDERAILTGLIIDDFVLAKVASAWGDGLFQSEWANTVAGWCVGYYERYSRAPGEDVEQLFNTWASQDRDKDTTKLIDRFLSGLSDDYEELADGFNAQFVVDQADTYFNRVKLDRMTEKVKDTIDVGKVEDALKLVHEYRQIEISSGSGVNIFDDKASLEEAFNAKREPLITYPGCADAFFGEILERDGFVSFLGPEKRGKTWMLIDLAVRALKQRRRVAFFEVGDMSQNQILRRFATRIARRPLMAGTIKYPVDIANLGGPHCEVTHEDKEYLKPMSWQAAWKAMTKFSKSHIKSKDSYFKLSCHPTSTIGADGVRATLKQWMSNERWMPDVIVIDYADILAPPAGYMDSREAINGTWKKLRALSQELHCLVVTATQADAGSYKADSLDRTNFSEDKRKMAHVTGMIGLNATPEEKELGLMRLNWIVNRESNFSKELHMAGCLGIGNPCIQTSF